LNFGADTCGSCVETSCCSENAACAADATCASCFAANPSASCSQNASYRALAHCVVSGCHNQCDYGKCGVASDTAACTACMDSQCCAETLNCVGKQGCYDCLVGNTSAGCDSIPEFVAQLGCLRQKCAGPTDCDIPSPPVHIGPGSGGSAAAGSGAASGVEEVGASGTGGAGGSSDAGTRPKSTAGGRPRVETTETTHCGCRTASAPAAPSAELFALATLLGSIVRRKRILAPARPRLTAPPRLTARTSRARSPIDRFPV
jgi:MYXO-CTERM domain-containing protein